MEQTVQMANRSVMLSSVTAWQASRERKKAIGLIHLYFALISADLGVTKHNAFIRCLSLSSCALTPLPQ